LTALDNAAAESFNSTLEHELLSRTRRRATRRLPHAHVSILDVATTSARPQATRRSKKHSRVKQYLKEGRAFRIETVINKPSDIGCLARLEHLPELIAKAQ